MAVILDVFSRLVVGWAMGETNDEQLVRNALEMALAHRSPPAEMLLHSDQGSPYTATNYLARLAEKGIRVSMSRTGECYDNAAMESFFSTLKGECVDRHRFQSRRDQVSVFCPGLVNTRIARAEHNRPYAMRQEQQYGPQQVAKMQLDQERIQPEVPAKTPIRRDLALHQSFSRFGTRTSFLCQRPPLY